MNTIDPQFRALVRTAGRSAAAKVPEVQAAKGYLPKYSDFPAFTEDPFRSGFPHFRSLFADDAPAEYRDIFGVARSPMSHTSVTYDEIEGLDELFAYADSDEKLREYFGRGLGSDESLDRIFYRMSIAGIVFSAVDRLIHLFGLQFDDEQFESVYAELELGIFETNLPIEIVVPICLTHVDLDGRADLAPGLSLERMDSGWQLARQPDSQFGAGVAASPTVVGAATHAFVLSGWTMPNTLRASARTSRFGFYPVTQVDRAFQALRIATDYRTGYAQLAIRPLGWAFRWKAHLPACDPGALVRRYPAKFDEWGWLIDPPTQVSSDEIKGIADAYSALTDAPTNLQLAGRRLANAVLRDEEEDRIVDLCIGLEAALGDKTPTEITHKLALRTASVLAAAEGMNAAETFRRVKKVYGYRSAVVHGLHPERHRLIRVAGAEDPAVEVAEECLRLVLRALLANDAWRDPAHVDETLVLQSAGVQAPTRDAES